MESTHPTLLPMEPVNNKAPLNSTNSSEDTHRGRSSEEPTGEAGLSTTEEAGGLGRQSWESWVLLLSFCFANFFVQVFYSLLGPFFTIEAGRKGVGDVTIGMIYGINELVGIFVSPILGIYLNQIGARFMYITGILVAGYCSVLFGFVDYVPSGPAYIALCFLIRGVEGIGGAAVTTATFAVLGYNFPTRIGTVYGVVETFASLGMMVGPPIGGTLYQFGGFLTPFLVSGGLIILFGISAICIVKETKVDFKLGDTCGKWSILWRPVVILAMLLIVLGSAVVTFLTSRVSVFLTDDYGLSPLEIGLVCFSAPFTYMLSAPFWGAITDRKPEHGLLYISLGYLFAGLSLLVIGPTPLLHFLSGRLWVFIVAFGFAGFGLGSFVISFEIISSAARAAFGGTLTTYGCTAAIINTCYALGAFSGPPIGGYIHGKVGFDWACSVFAGALATLAALSATYYVVTRCRNARDRSGEERHLLAPKETSRTESHFPTKER